MTPIYHMNERQRRAFLDSSRPIKMSYSQWNLTKRYQMKAKDLFFYMISNFLPKMS